MESHQFDSYLDKARQIAIQYRHEYLTSEHLFAALLSDREVIRAFRDMDIPIPFVRKQLEHYFRHNLDRAADDVSAEELGKMTDTLQGIVSRVLMQALSSGRDFPRAIDFIIALGDDKYSFVRAMFDATHHSSLEFMEWAASHPIDDMTRKRVGSMKPADGIDDGEEDDDDDDFEDGNEEDADDADFEAGEDEDEDGDDGDDGDAESGRPRMPNSVLAIVDGFLPPGGLFGIDRIKQILKNAVMNGNDGNVKIHFMQRDSHDASNPEDVSREENAEREERESGEGDAGSPAERMGSQKRASRRREDQAAFRRIRGFVTRLVDKARRGGIDPVVGRDKEIETCCLALLRRTKSNVLIVGEAGVGKTAIVEGLARAIARGEVPKALQDFEIYALDVSALMAGTKFRGEMEERLKSVVRYVETHMPAVLFIDELQSASGAERGSGAQEIMTYLKPRLASGSIKVIGTATYEDYRRSISNDSALVRRFHKLDIEEPNEETTRYIIEALKPHYEQFHNVGYTDEALTAAVALTAKHMPERRFPDKAIDIIDEAGAAHRMTCSGQASENETKVIGLGDIEKIVAKVARIPDLQVSSDEGELLQNAERCMKSAVFGQDAGIETLVRLIKLSRAGIRAEHKPVANLLFAGPTGVGKTEVARQFAKALNLPFVRFDMSEYREEYSVSKFIGSSPGYVGYERGGLLTEAVRAKPNCVLLLDEIEKAHSAIFDLLLQVMDAASLTDNTGKTADFRNVTLIMTSNSGSADMERRSIGFDSKIDVTNGLKEIEKTFSPEFRNRLDEVILFNPLSPESMECIVRRMVGDLSVLLSQRSVVIDITSRATQWFAEHGYDPQFGARPMARLIQKEISVPLSEEILFGRLKSGGNVKVDYDVATSKICFIIDESAQSI